MDDSDSETKQWLEQLVCEAFNTSSLRPFQEEQALGLYRGRDVLLTISTGQGKTIVPMSPLLAAKAKGELGIGFAIVLIKVLTQQLKNTANIFGTPVFAVTGDTLRDSPVDLFEAVKEKPGI